jgi:hypothetical protein
MLIATPEQVLAESMTRARAASTGWVPRQGAQGRRKSGGGALTKPAFSD